jgi:tetratricopeptide (TPR) repeat protein
VIYDLRAEIIKVMFLCISLCFSSFSQDQGNIFSNHIKALMIDGRNKAAIQELDSVLQRDSSDSNTCYLLGLNYEALADYVNAVKFLNIAVRIQPDNEKFLESLGSNYYSSGLITEADTVLSRAFLLDSTGNHILIRLGEVYMNEKKWAEACKIYSGLVTKDSGNSFFYQQLAQCYSNLGNPGEAIRYNRVAHSLNPKNLKIIIDLTYLLYIRDQLQEALSILNNGLKNYQCISVLWKWKGDVYFKKNDFDSALYSYRRSFYCGDSTGNILKSMGICFYQTQKYSYAVNLLEESIELDPKDYITFFYLGASYKALNKMNKALDNLEIADTLLQNDFHANVYMQLGAIYQAQNKYKKALDCYKDALRENPENRSGIFYLAAMSDKLKNYKDAQKYYKIFLDDPDNPDIKLEGFAKQRISELKNQKIKN